jgi:two-component system, NarL family, nitrate/nitrite response regulator NarL
MEKTRLFLLDDHQIMLDGLRSLLQDDDTFIIAGEATRAEDALKEIPKCNPSIVITDISLPGMNGIEFTKQIRILFPEIKVIVLTVSAGEHNISELIRQGVSGYVLKNAGRDELKKALSKIARNEKYFSSEVAEGLIKLKDGVTTSGDLHLTPRELEVLNLIAKECSNQQIADQLFISERTVESHRKNIFRKTGAKSIVGLIRFAIDNGYISD